MHRYLFVLIIAAGAIGVTANTSRRSAADPDNGGGDTSNSGESITGEIATPNEAPTSVPKSPFEPYGIGEVTAETNPAWSYEQLNSAEQAVVDAGRNASGWSAVHDAYKSAAVLRGAEAAAQAAAIQLGIENLGEGVVP